MGVDYRVDYPCGVKRELSLEGMIELIKGKNRADAILVRARQSGDQRPPTEIHIKYLLQTAQGVVQQEVSVQALLDKSQVLDEYESHCQDCPANALEQSFGCYGYISYPLRKQTEEWLMSLLPDNLDTTAGNILRSAVRDFKYDGGPLLNMRRDPRFFESNRPVKRQWGTFLSH